MCTWGHSVGERGKMVKCLLRKDFKSHLPGTSESFKRKKIKKGDLFLALASGLLLTGAFPKFGIDWLAWFALVPLLFSVKDCSPKNSFQLGLLTGFIHYLTLIYWLSYTMRTYGHLDWFSCIAILILFSVYLSLYIAIFALALTRLCAKPLICVIMIPIFWVSLEYMRSVLLSGFPWELIGYSQYKNWHVIQISDIFGVYGVSFLIAMINGAIFLVLLYVTQTEWQGLRVPKVQAVGFPLICGFIFCLVWFYGQGRINSIDERATGSPSVSVSIVQGNIDQALKWNPAFQLGTIEKYLRLSLSTRPCQPDLVVWPETAAPFYFLRNPKLTEMVLEGIRHIGTDFLIGSPSYIPKGKNLGYYNSVYLVRPDGKILGKYDKVHLVPFGEYVPFKNWFPFIGKIVAAVGDFQPGQKGNTLQWKNYKLGVQICYEIIFPDLSRAMVKNNAGLLVNVTNDAWYGRSSAPYQHFSMSIFRAVENRRALIRSANTGISGFVDPAGRIVVRTPLFQENVITHTMPVIQVTTFYTRFGDVLAKACIGATLIVIIIMLGRAALKKGS
jgi:apolipoprotein N-acyltransferase